MKHIFWGLMNSILRRICASQHLLSLNWIRSAFSRSLSLFLALLQIITPLAGQWVFADESDSVNCDAVCAPYRSGVNPAPSPSNGPAQPDSGQLKSACDELHATEVSQVEEMLVGLDVLAAASCFAACYYKDPLQGRVDPENPHLNTVSLKALSHFKGEMFIRALIALDSIAVANSWAGKDKKKKSEKQLADVQLDELNDHQSQGAPAAESQFFTPENKILGDDVQIPSDRRPRSRSVEETKSSHDSKHSQELVENLVRGKRGRKKERQELFGDLDRSTSVQGREKGKKGTNRRSRSSGGRRNRDAIFSADDVAELRSKAEVPSVDSIRVQIVSPASNDHVAVKKLSQEAVLEEVKIGNSSSETEQPVERRIQSFDDLSLLDKNAQARRLELAQERLSSAGKLGLELVHQVKANEADIQHLKSEQERLQSELAQSQQDLEKARKELSTRERQGKKVKVLKEHIAAIEEQNAQEVEQHRQSHERAIERYKAQLKEVESALQVKSSDHDKLAQQVKALAKENAEIAAERDALFERRMSLRKQFESDLREIYEEHSSEIDKRNKKITDLQRALEDKSDALRKATVTGRDYTLLKREYEALSELYENENQEYRRMVDSLQEEIQRLRNENIEKRIASSLAEQMEDPEEEKESKSGKHKRKVAKEEVGLSAGASDHVDEDLREQVQQEIEKNKKLQSEMQALKAQHEQEILKLHQEYNARIETEAKRALAAEDSAKKLKAELENAKRKAQSYLKQAEEFQKAKQTFEKMANERSAKVSQLTAQVNSLEKRKNALVDQIREGAIQRDELQKELGKRDQSIQDLRKINKKLTAEQEQILEALEQQKRDFEHQLSEKDKSLQAMERELRESNERGLKLKADLDVATAKLHELGELNQKQAQELLEKQQLLNLERENVNRIQTDLVQRTKELQLSESERANLNAALEDVNRQLDSAQKAVKKVEAELELTRQKLAQTEAQLNESLAKASHLDQRLKEQISRTDVERKGRILAEDSAKKLEAELESTKKKAQEYLKQAEEFQKSKRTFEKMANERSAKISQLTAQVSSLEEQRNELADQIREGTIQRDELQKELAKRDQSIQDLRKLNKKLTAEQRRMLEALEQQKRDFEHQLSEKDKSLQSTERELRESNERGIKLKTDLDEATAKMHELGQLNQKQAQELLEKQRLLDLEREKVIGLQKDLEKRAQVLHLSESERLKLSADLENVNHQLSFAKESLARMKDELAQQKEQFQLREKQLAEQLEIQRRAAEVAHSELGQLRLKMEQLQENAAKQFEKERNKRKIAKAFNQLRQNAAEARAQRAEQSLADLQSQLSELQKVYNRDVVLADASRDAALTARDAALNAKDAAKQAHKAKLLALHQSHEEDLKAQSDQHQAELKAANEAKLKAEQESKEAAKAKDVAEAKMRQDLEHYQAELRKQAERHQQGAKLAKDIISDQRAQIRERQARIDAQVETIKRQQLELDNLRSAYEGNLQHLQRQYEFALQTRDEAFKLELEKRMAELERRFHQQLLDKGQILDRRYEARRAQLEAEFYRRGQDLAARQKSIEELNRQLRDQFNSAVNAKDAEIAKLQNEKDKFSSENVSLREAGRVLQEDLLREGDQFKKIQKDYADYARLLEQDHQAALKAKDVELANRLAEQRNAMEKQFNQILDGHQQRMAELEAENEKLQQAKADPKLNSTTDPQPSQIKPGDKTANSSQTQQTTSNGDLPAPPTIPDQEDPTGHTAANDDQSTTDSKSSDESKTSSEKPVTDTTSEAKARDTAHTASGGSGIDPKSLGASRAAEEAILKATKEAQGQTATQACRILGGADALASTVQVFMMEGSGMSKAFSAAQAAMGGMVVADPSQSCIAALVFASMAAGRGYNLYKTHQSHEEACSNVKKLASNSAAVSARSGVAPSTSNLNNPNGGKGGPVGKLSNTQDPISKVEDSASEVPPEAQVSKALSGNAPDQNLLRLNSDLPRLRSNVGKLQGIADQVKNHGPSSALGSVIPGGSAAGQAVLSFAKHAETHPAAHQVFSNNGIGTPYSSGGAAGGSHSGSSSDDFGSTLANLFGTQNMMKAQEQGLGAPTVQQEFRGADLPDDVLHTQTPKTLFDIISHRIQAVSYRVSP